MKTQIFKFTQQQLQTITIYLNKETIVDNIIDVLKEGLSSDINSVYELSLTDDDFMYMTDMIDEILNITPENETKYSDVKEILNILIKYDNNNCKALKIQELPII